MTTPDKLTLERLAALDEALPGRWFAEHGLTGEECGQHGGTDPCVVQEAYDEDGEPCPVEICVACASDRVADFIAASKGAAPRLLAALVQLEREMKKRAKEDYENGRVQAAGPVAMYARKLRALLTDLDLRAEPGADQ